MLFEGAEVAVLGRALVSSFLRIFEVVVALGAQEISEV
jgi:hypothetical protein